MILYNKTNEDYHLELCLFPPWLIVQKSMYKELSHSDTTKTQEGLTTNFR